MSRVQLLSAAFEAVNQHLAVGKANAHRPGGGFGQLEPGPLLYKLVVQIKISHYPGKKQ